MATLAGGEPKRICTVLHAPTQHSARSPNPSILPPNLTGRSLRQLKKALKEKLAERQAGPAVGGEGGAAAEAEDDVDDEEEGEEGFEDAEEELFVEVRGRQPWSAALPTMPAVPLAANIVRSAALACHAGRC